MESSLNLDSWMSTTKSEKSDGTKNRIIREIWKAIDDKFNNNVNRFMANKYSGSQMTRQPQKTESSPSFKQVNQTNGDEIVNTLTINGTTENKISSWRQRIRFLFGTADMACHTTNNKQSQDEISLSAHMRHHRCSINGQINTIGANRRQWCGIEYD